MAQSDLIKTKDFFESDFLKDPIEQIDELATSLIALKNGLSDVHTESTKFLKANKDPKSYEDLKKLNEELSKSTKARQGLIAVDKHLLDLEIQKEKLKQAQLKTEADTLKALKLEQAEIDKKLKQQQKEEENLKKNQSAYKKLSDQLNESRKRYKDLAAEEKANTAEGVKLLVQITQLDRKLKEIDASVGQFNRSVGDYSNQVQDALEKTGFFGDIISKITEFVELFESVTAISTSAIEANTVATEVNTGALELNVAVTEAEILAHEQNIVALQAETVATEKLSLAKRVLNAITSPVGLILLAVGAVYALYKAVENVNQSVRDFNSIKAAQGFDALNYSAQALKGSTEDIVVTFAEAERATISFRKEIGLLELQLQELEDTESDLGEIASDETRTLNERTEATKKLQQARIDSANKNLEIAKKAKLVADLNLQAQESNALVGKGNALQEFYDKQIEAQKKLFDAEDRLGDLERTNAQESRRLFDETIINNIELLRSKKLGADSEVETLKQQVADEGNLIAERRKNLQLLTDAQINAQNEEVKLLEKFGLTKTEIENLIAEKDAVKLARQLEELGRTRLDIAQKETLAKVVLESQKNELDRANQQSKIDEKEIANKATILKLENEIKQIKLDETVKNNLEDLQKAQESLNVMQQKTFEQDNLFNKEQINATIKKYDKIDELSKIANQSEIDAIKNKYKDQKDLIRKQIEDGKIEREIGLKEIQKLNELENNELKDKIDIQIIAETNKQKFLKDLKRKQFQAEIQDLQSVTDALGNELDRRAEKQERAYDRDIAKRQTSIQRQSELAQKGLANNLAFEESQLAKSELKKKQLQERQAREQRAVELVKSYFNFLNSRLSQPKSDPNTAPFKALTDVVLSEGIAKGFSGLSGFIDGTDMVERDMQGYKYSNEQDGYVARFDGKEAIIPPKENLENRSAVKSLVNGTFKDNFIPISQLQEASRNIQRGTAENIYNSILIQQNSKILSTLEEIKNKPIQQVDVDGFKNLIETVHYSNSIAVTTHKTSRRRL
jgi:hypothetical protein